MTSELCRWCGKPLQVVTTVDGRVVARQCPLCLRWAPPGEDVGKNLVVRHRGLTAAEQRARKVAKAAKAARQRELFK